MSHRHMPLSEKLKELFPSFGWRKEAAKILDRVRMQAEKYVINNYLQYLLHNNMKSKATFFHCGDQLRGMLAGEISDIESVLRQVQWSSSFHIEKNGDSYEHQTAYNKAFSEQFSGLGWESQPLLRVKPKLIGDFRRGLVFVEIQFGNSSTLYRDYYKFQYGFANGLLSLAVLIVPTKPSEFFPTRPKSVLNMAEYDLAYTCLTVLPINVPVLLVGLLPDN